MTLMWGSRKVVVCNDPESLKSLTSGFCAGRFNTLFTENDYSKLKYEQGPNWIEHRKMSQAYLLGPTAQLDRADILTKSTHNLVEDFREKAQTGESFEPSFMISKALFSSVSELVFRKSISEDTVKVLRNQGDKFIQFLISWQKFCVVIPFKWFRRVLFRGALVALGKRNQTLNPMIESSMASFDPKSAAKSYVDLVLQKQHRLVGKGKKPDYLDDAKILNFAALMVTGGGAGALFTLKVAFSKLAALPEWQEKLYREVISTGPTHPSVSELRDPGRFPSLVAFVKELLRVN
eukprot:498457_1